MKKTEKSNTNEIIEIPAEEAPYALPDGWKWVRFGDFSTNQYGYSAKAVDDDKLPKMLRITDIQDNGVDWKTVPGCKIEDSKLDQYRLVDNDIVIARIGATTGKSFLINKPPLNAVFASYLIRVRFSKDFLPKYVYCFLQSETYWKQISDLSSGIALPGVNSTKLQTMMFPFPPLETQKRIVERIESLFAKLDEAKEKAQAALDTFELRKSAILHKAFTGELTAQWRSSCRASDTSSASAHIESAPADISSSAPAEHIDNTSSAPVEHLNSVSSVPIEDSNNIVSVPIEDSNNIVSVPIKDPNNELSVPTSLSPKQAESDSIEQDIDNSKESLFVSSSEYYQNLMSSNLRLKKAYSTVNGWVYSTLEKVCKTIKYGTSKKSDTVGKVVVLRMGNMRNGEIDWSDLAFTNDEEDIKKYWLQKDDVLFNRTNSAEWVGKVSIYRGEHPAIYAGYIIKLDYDRELLKGEYLNYILNSPEEREYCQAVKTDGVNQSNINSKKIGSFVIPIPSIEEQLQIIKVIKNLLAKENAAKEAAEAVIEKIDLMKKSILARAFRGEL